MIIEKVIHTTIDTITVAGLKNFSDRTVVTYSGLRQGQSIQVPGEEVSAVLKKLWNLELFSDVNLYVTDVNNGKIKLEINVDELPTLLNYQHKWCKEEVRLKLLKKKLNYQKEKDFQKVF